ncbi:hypothetical protein HDV01_000162 [Terramyces sp. JEL0728]|nr:hypothetical protein HDV01_000162 [Terramyces sp. JEL0728]
MNSSLPTGIIAQWDEYYKRYYYFGTLELTSDTKTGVSKWELADGEHEKSVSSDRTAVLDDKLTGSASLPLGPKFTRPIAAVPAHYAANASPYPPRAAHSYPSSSHPYPPSTANHSSVMRSEMPYVTRKYYTPKVFSYPTPYPVPYAYRPAVTQAIPRARMVRYQPYIQPTYVKPAPEYTQKKYVHPSNSYIFGKEIRKSAS